MTSFIWQSMIDFSAITLLTPGLVNKFGLQSAAADENGVGTGVLYAQSTAANYEYSQGGIRKTISLIDAPYACIRLALDAVSRAKLKFEGRVQFDLNLSSLLTQSDVATTGTLADFVDSSYNNIGPNVTIDYTNIPTVGFRAATDGYNGAIGITPCCTMNGQGLVHAEEKVSPILLHSNTPTVDGWVTFTFSWSPSSVEWYQNGLCISHNKRAAIAANDFYELRLLQGLPNDVVIRNVIVMTTPVRRKAIGTGGRFRIAVLSHSFFSTWGHLQYHGAKTNSAWGSCGPVSLTAEDFPLCNLAKKFNADIINVSYSGLTSTNILGLINNTIAYQYVNPNSSVKTTGLAIVGDGTWATVTHPAHGKVNGDWIGMNITAGNTSLAITTTSGKQITVIDANTYRYANPTNSTATGTVSELISNRVVRFKPHICLLAAMANEGNSGTYANNIDLINKYLIGDGIVPIWILEQPTNAAAGTTRIAYYNAAIAQIAANKASLVVNGIELTALDIGLIDLWALTVDASSAEQRPQFCYVESSANGVTNHWNAKSQIEVATPAIEAEVRRIFHNPPSYAWWA